MSCSVQIQAYSEAVEQAEDIPAVRVAGIQAEQAEPELPVSEQSSSNSTTCLIMGIVSVACGCSFYLSLIGIVFGIIGLVKAGKFSSENGSIYGKAKVGKYLSLGGLIASIVMGAIFIFYLFAIILLAAEY